MKRIPVNSLGFELTRAVPDSIEEYNALAPKRDNPVLEDATANILYRSTFAKFRDALVHAPLQLTRRDINVLCAEAEQTADGFVDVRREAEHAFPLLCLSGEFTKFDQEHD